MATFITCKRCEGKGRLAHFGHVNNGVCIKCKGAGRVMKTKRVKITETHFTVVYKCNGTRVQCGADKAKADKEMEYAAGILCEVELATREVIRTENVPA